LETRAHATWQAARKINTPVADPHSISLTVDLRDLQCNVRGVMQYLCPLALTHAHAEEYMHLFEVPNVRVFQNTNTFFSHHGPTENTDV